MCSWCYAFAPVLERLLPSLPASVEVVRLLGGLAPDNKTPMAPEMRQRIIATWQRIEKAVPGIRFNYDFWTVCTPYRSTYPSCRAVIAATAGGPEYDKIMTSAIQRAYYEQARNPSEVEILVSIAGEIGLAPQAFATAIASEQTEQELKRQIGFAAELGVDSFPSLILEVRSGRWPIPVDYNDPAPMLDTIHFLLED